MLDQLRPRLLPTAEVRRRSDGTEGIYDAVSGRSFETAPDQSNLVQFFDGSRSLLEISAEHLNRYGFVPFAALTDLVRALAEADLLENPPASLRHGGMSATPSWTELLAPRVLFSTRAFAPTWFRAIEVLGWMALAAYFALWPRAALTPLDVALVYPGAMLALTLRDRFKAAACGLFGFPPRRTRALLALGVAYVVPDHANAVLMDRRPRLLAHLAALAGSLCALAIGHPRPGLWAGAFVVLLADLCPFIRSSAGTLLATLANRVDLREHVRAYVGRPLLKSLRSFKLPRAERDLFFTALLSIAWVVTVVYVVVALGLDAAVRLIEVGIDGTGVSALLAYAGAGVLFTICPLLLLILLGLALDAAFTFLWTPDAGGKRAGGAADLAAFRAIPLFSKLSDADLAAIAAHSREVTYDAGQTIVEQGTGGNTFFSVRWGAVEVERQDPAGRTRAVARLGPGDCFGETALLQGGVRTATVRALAQTTVIELASEAFDKVCATVGGVDFATVLRAATAIGKSRLFKDLPTERLSSLAMKFLPRTVAASTDVVRLGEPGDEFFLVGKGQLEVLDAAGNRLGQLFDGDHFGEIALLRNVPRTATVRTLTDSLLLVLSRDVFLQALGADLALSARAEEIAEARVSATTEPSPT
ncbi:MAG: cyclic nucleotide-binding domain-containing protein [Myxococcota bacterium]